MGKIDKTAFSGSRNITKAAQTSDVANQTPFVLFVPKPNQTRLVWFGLVKIFPFGRLYQTGSRPQTKPNGPQFQNETMF
jgi:hypothetical protein